MRVDDRDNIIFYVGSCVLYMEDYIIEMNFGCNFIAIFYSYWSCEDRGKIGANL